MEGYSEVAPSIFIYFISYNLHFWGHKVKNKLEVTRDSRLTWAHLWLQLGPTTYIYWSFFKVPITPQNAFHLVQSLYGIRKNSAKIFAFVSNPNFL